MLCAICHRRIGKPAGFINHWSQRMPIGPKCLRKAGVPIFTDEDSFRLVRLPAVRKRAAVASGGEQEDWIGVEA